MPLPTPQLDDRRFQDIVDQAKTLIPHFCPEWTDHNVSDPGVTLIELFAWMTDLLLYRVNQVPDKVYIKFLELLGVRLASPRGARGPVTFYLSAPLQTEVTIPEGTEVATIRTETSASIIFTTETDVVVRPPIVSGAYTGPDSPDAPWTTHDLRQLELPNRRLPIFPSRPAPGDSFYISLERDHSQHILAVVMDVETAGGAGVDPRNPPIEWQVFQGGSVGWAPCEVEYDGTGGFNWSGEVILHLPSVAPTTLRGVTSYWLRCRLTDAQARTNPYRVSPDLQRLRVESRGATGPARHAVTVRNELLGRSDGTPGQSFKLLNSPLLARDPSRDYLLVEPPGGESERWSEVSDFGDSGPADRHYTLDGLDGSLTLGPALLQPDGTVYRFGAVPPRDCSLTFTRYQYGGGVVGNLPKGALSALKTSIPYVARVTNRAPTLGGRDAQSLEDAKLRAPQFLRTRTRAVTADDYEYLATQVSGVGRALCLAPGELPGAAGDPKPGQVAVVILPQVDEPAGSLAPEQLVVPADLRSSVRAYLDERRLLGTSLEVQAPKYTWVTVQAKLRVARRRDQLAVLEVERQATAELYRYLNPLVGGPRGDGWPFGRDLHVSEVYGLLQRVPGVEFVEDVQVGVIEPGGAVRPAPPRLALPRDGVVCSGQHRVVVGRE